MKKIGNSFAAIPIGLLVIIVGIFVLIVNEGNNVNNIKTTNEASKVVVDVKSDSIDPANNEKLIATNGPLTLTGNELTDAEFNITVKTAKLIRTVEMYQWDEDTKTDENGNDISTYRRVWSKSLISSTGFNSGYENPDAFPYEQKTYIADGVMLGKFKLTDQQLNQLKTPNKIIPNPASVPNGFHVAHNYITNSNDYNNPQIGDIRITFSYNNDQEASVLAVQNNDTFKSFISKNGGSINRLEGGTYTGAEMITHIVNENKLTKWISRGIGFLLIVVGIAAILGPISTLASFVPFFGRLVGNIIGLIALLSGLCISLIVIAISWFAFRPLLSIILLAIVIIIGFLLGKIIKKNKAKEISNSEINSTLKSAQNTPIVNNQPSQPNIVENTIPGNIETTPVQPTTPINSEKQNNPNNQNPV